MAGQRPFEIEVLMNALNKADSNKKRKLITKACKEYLGNKSGRFTDLFEKIGKTNDGAKVGLFLVSQAKALGLKSQTYKDLELMYPEKVGTKWGDDAPYLPIVYNEKVIQGFNSPIMFFSSRNNPTEFHMRIDTSSEDGLTFANNIITGLTRRDGSFLGAFNNDREINYTNNQVMIPFDIMDLYESFMPRFRSSDFARYLSRYVDLFDFNSENLLGEISSLDEKVKYAYMIPEFSNRGNFFYRGYLPGVPTHQIERLFRGGIRSSAKDEDFGIDREELVLLKGDRNVLNLIRDRGLEEIGVPVISLMGRGVRKHEKPVENLRDYMPTLRENFPRLRN